MSFYVSALSDETLFQAIFFSYGTSMDGVDFNTSEKNEGLALVKKNEGLV